jgi:hypothetical protein
MRIGQSHRNAECPNRNGPSSGGGDEAGAILGETARRRPVTFSYQPITSGSPPLISFAHFQVSCGDGPVDYGDSVQFRHTSLARRSQ